MWKRAVICSFVCVVVLRIHGCGGGEQETDSIVLDTDPVPLLLQLREGLHLVRALRHESGLYYGKLKPLFPSPFHHRSMMIKH